MSREATNAKFIQAYEMVRQTPTEKFKAEYLAMTGESPSPAIVAAWRKGWEDCNANHELYEDFKKRLKESKENDQTN